MKKIAFLAFCILVLVSVVRGIVFSPSTLEIKIMLAEGGEDIADQLQTYVGIVPEGKSGPPNLGNIRILKPIYGNAYEVPPNRRIGIFVISRGVPPFQSTVSVKPRQNLKHDVVLDAGIVQVTTQHIPNTANSKIWFIGPDGQFDNNASFRDGMKFMVPAGEQVFQVDRYLEAKRERIDVIAGQIQHLNIVSKTGSLSIEIDTTKPFAELSPTPVLIAKRGRKLLHLRDDDFDAGRWQFGTYETTLRFSERFRFPIRSTSTNPFKVIIDQSENTMVIPLSIIGVEARFNGWTNGIPEYAMAFVFSITDPGLPFATYRVTDKRAPLMFITPTDEHEYAITLVANNEVLALQAIGTLSADKLQKATVVPGGDTSLCETIVLDFDCKPLSQ